MVEVHARLEHRRVAVRRVHRVRRGQSLPARRQQAVSLEDDGLRHELDAHRQRHRHERVHARRARGSRASADCSSPAPSAACGSRTTTARTGRRCGSICRSCRCTISRSSEGDLIVATHGRSFYVMDDISTLEQMTDADRREAGASVQAARSVSPRAVAVAAAVADVAVAAARRRVTPENAPVHPTGQNPPSGVTVQYWLKTGGEDVGLDFLDATGKIDSHVQRARSTRRRRAAPRSRRRRGRLWSAAAGAARPEPQRRQHIPVEHALPRRVELSRNDSLGRRT